mgnify:CR=1 FL=1
MILADFNFRHSMLPPETILLLYPRLVNVKMINLEALE